MARILAATVPLTGHVQPMLLVVRALVERGHTVAWYAAKKFAPRIEAAGACYIAMRAAHDWDDAHVEAELPALRGKRGLGRVKAQLRVMFIEPMVDQLHDLEAASDAFMPDVVVGDQAHLGAALLHEKHGVPWAQLGISGLVIPSIDTAPFGSALPPSRGPRDQPRNRLLNWLVLRKLFGSVNRAYRAKRVDAGLPAGEATYFDVVSPQLYLHPTIPAFEYPRSDLPPQVHFIGPLVPNAPTDADALPPWWSDVDTARRAGTPIVFVSQGTLATDPRELIAPTLRALADDNVLVVAVNGPLQGEGAQALGGTIPSNARLAAFIPYHAVMAMASVFVTNGGYGGVQMALRHGLPIVVAGGSEEKPEIAARVAWSGVGIDLRSGTPSAKAIRTAVHRVLTEPSFRERVKALARDMADYDGPVRGAELIEQLALERAPIHRPDAMRLVHAALAAPGLQTG